MESDNNVSQNRDGTLWCRNYKKNKMEDMSLNCSTTEIINSLEDLNQRFQEAVGKRRELKGGSVETVKLEEQKQQRMNKNKLSLRNLWDTINPTDICISEVPKEGKKNKAKRVSEEITTEKFTKLVEYINLYMKEAQ